MTVLRADALAAHRSELSAALISRSAQEAYDHALLARRLARDRHAVVYHYIAKEAEQGDVQDVQDVDAWLQTGLSTPPLNGNANGQANGATDPVDEPAQQLLKTFDSAALALLKLTRRHRSPSRTTRTAASRLAWSSTFCLLPSRARTCSMSRSRRQLPRTSSVTPLNRSRRLSWLKPAAASLAPPGLRSSIR